MTGIAVQQTYVEPITLVPCAGKLKAVDVDGIGSEPLDFGEKFLPDTLSRVHEVDFLDAPERVLLSQVQGRTYVNMRRLLEFVIDDKMSQLKQEHYAANPALAGVLGRCSDDERRQLGLFKNVSKAIAAGMPGGYRFVCSGQELASMVLARSGWAVLGLSFHAELLTQTHYKHSMLAEAEMSQLFMEMLRHNWRDESRHTIVDGIEWAREDMGLDETERDQALGELVALFAAVERVLRRQAEADVRYFLSINRRPIGHARRDRLLNAVAGAYRWQFIEIGLCVPRFGDTLRSFVTANQFGRFERAMQQLVRPPSPH